MYKSTTCVLFKVRIRKWKYVLLKIENNLGGDFFVVRK